MRGSGFTIHEEDSTIRPPEVRYTGIADRTEALMSKHLHATSTSSLNRDPMSQFGVDHSAGHPAHGEGCHAGELATGLLTLDLEPVRIAVALSGSHG